MPTYDYVCQACGRRLELFQPMSEAPKKKCPSCGKPKLQRQIGMGAAVLFKGSGFYQTDYRSSSYAEGAKKEAPEVKPADSGKGGEAKSPAGESKSAEKGESAEKRGKTERKKPE